eukprot:TRINITY_DN590_c0_g2_i5.p1 TRINITY_DN590_c0_g2~~TRINITY_DN590_c0_g2_i5.p1  ORF type:complete len:451 (-),score=107.75 TRINITY_DN590_c0_g2_i5:1794-3146(-)
MEEGQEDGDDDDDGVEETLRRKLFGEESLKCKAMTPTATTTTSDGDDYNLSSAPSSKSVRTPVDFSKAGLDKADKTLVENVIYENSKHSGFYRHALRRGEEHERQLGEMIEKRSVFHANMKRDMAFRERVDSSVQLVVDALESEMDRSRTWIHVDMDAFYASVEELDDPSLRGIPMAVGGNSMLSTSNYQARKFGVRSGMPGFLGKKLCPQLKIVRPNVKRYKEINVQMREIFREYDPEHEAMSLDEAALDVTETICERNEKDGSTYWTGDQIASEIRERIQTTTGLTASCGVACNRMLAKICSDMNKPNGTFVLARDETSIREFMWNLPLRKVPGIGKVSEKLLNGLGIVSGLDLWNMRHDVFHLFSERSFRYFMRICLGCGRFQHPRYENKHRKAITISVRERYLVLAMTSLGWIGLWIVDCGLWYCFEQGGRRSQEHINGANIHANF